MTSPLPFTGERFTPECAAGIWYEHWHRYVLVRDWVAGKVVLDAACGEGYGSAFLATVAGKVTGIDVSAEAVEHARFKYGNASNLDYQQASVTAIPMGDASVDVIVSFETIEHLEQQESMLAEFRRVLRPDGFLVLSAPNRPVYSDEQNYRNEYHVREHDRAELNALLSTRFAKMSWFGQRLQFNSAIWRLDGESGLHGRASSRAMEASRLQPFGWLPDAMYFLVVCGGESAELPRVDDLSLFADEGQSVLKQYEHLMAWQWEARDRIAQVEGELAQLSRQSAAQLAARDGELGTSRARVAALQAEVDRLTTLAARSDSAAAGFQRELESLRTQFEYRNSLVGWLRWPLHRLRKLLGS